LTIERWYVAVRVVSSKFIGQESITPVLDLQYRVVRAASHEGAYQRALTFVVAKERLTVFWVESNKDKTAAEILDE